MLERKVLRSSSRAGEGVGWKTGSGPEMLVSSEWRVG